MEEKPDKGDKDDPLPLPTLDLLNADEDTVNELINKLLDLESQLAVLKTTINDELNTSTLSTDTAPSTQQTSQDQRPSTSTDFPPVQFPPNFNPVFTVSPEMENCAIPFTSPRSVLTEPAGPSGSVDNSDVQQPSSSGTSNKGDGPQVKSARRATWGPPRLLFPLQAPTPREDEQNPNEQHDGGNPDEAFVENNSGEETERQNQPSNPLPSTPKRTAFDILGPFPFLHYPAVRFRANFNPVYTVSPEMKNCSIPCSPRSVLTKPARPTSRGYSEVKQPAASGRLSTGDAPEDRSTRRPSWISPNFPLSARTTPRRTPRIVERTAEQQNVEANIISEETNDQQNSYQRSIQQSSNERFTDEGFSNENLDQSLAENVPAEETNKQDENLAVHNQNEVQLELDEELIAPDPDEEFVECITDEEFVEANENLESIDPILGEKSFARNVEERSEEQNPDIEFHGRVCENSIPGPSNHMLSDFPNNVQPEKRPAQSGPSTADDAPQVKPRAKWGPPSLPLLLQVTTPRFTPRLVWQTLEEEDGDDYEADIIEGDNNEDVEPEAEFEVEWEPIPEVHLPLPPPPPEDLSESDDENTDEDTDEDSLSNTDSSEDSSDLSDDDSTPSGTDEESDVDH